MDDEAKCIMTNFLLKESQKALREVRAKLDTDLAKEADENIHLFMIRSKINAVICSIEEMGARYGIE